MSLRVLSTLYHGKQLPGEEWPSWDPQWQEWRPGSFLLDERGFNIGLGPLAMEEDDIVVVLFGGVVPYILRPYRDRYTFIGECYVRGVMSCETITSLQEKGGWSNELNNLG
jgi:hypothetical protein